MARKKHYLQDVPVNELKPYHNNYQDHSENRKHILNSLRTFDQIKPIIVDENMVVICGHGTLEAMKELNWDVAPDVFQMLDMTEKEKISYRVADNETSRGAKIIVEKLLNEVAIVKDEFNLMDFGLSERFTILETDDDMAELDDATPDVPAEPTAKVGDMWQLGRHRLLCGDATNKDDVLRLCNGEAVDLLVTDPPYNVSYEGKTKDKLTIDNDQMGNDDFIAFLYAALIGCDGVLKPGGVFYIWHADSEGFNFRTACNEVGWKVRQCLIWNKNTMVMGRQDYHWKHEPCLYGWKEGASHHWNNDRKQTTMLEFDRPTRSDVHPTMKPISLIKHLIFNSSVKDDVVLDVFGGSGSSLLSSEILSRRCFTMELDPGYCEVIIKRWEDLTGDKAVKL